MYMSSSAAPFLAQCDTTHTTSKAWIMTKQNPPLFVQSWQNWNIIKVGCVTGCFSVVPFLTFSYDHRLTHFERFFLDYTEFVDVTCVSGGLKVPKVHLWMQREKWPASWHRSCCYCGWCNMVWPPETYYYKDTRALRPWEDHLRSLTCTTPRCKQPSLVQSTFSLLHHWQKNLPFVIVCVQWSNSVRYKHINNRFVYPRE